MILDIKVNITPGTPEINGLKRAKFQMPEHFQKR